MIDTKNLDFAKGNGLIPAIIQDADSYQILMLGYMNEEALQKTLAKKRVTFYSRSKQRLWTKGETSGNYLNLVGIQPDCDSDTLLILADAEGPTCHTGDTSCFHKKEFKPAAANLSFLTELEKLLKSRKEERPDGSYTASLFNEGLDRIAQKVGEEAVETVIEAKNNDQDRFVNETTDLLFHLMILLRQKEIPLKTIVQQLEKRHQNFWKCSH
jgi:phosphoribosyl-ATP pyrophosphohydrolase/phosphoribosyl-AMP cyclohydrolase